MDHQGRSASSSASTPSSSVNPQPHSSSSSRPPGGNGGSLRGPTATQACGQCRRRKIKCDEGQPKCSNCSKGDLDCEYRETQPTKKDKTQQEILEIVKRIDRRGAEQDSRILDQENRILDLISRRGSDSEISAAVLAQDSPVSLQSSRQAFTIEPSPLRASATTSHGEARRPSHHSRPSVGGISQPYRHASAAHKMLTWPAIQELLRNTGVLNKADLNSLSTQGSAFIIRMCEDMPKLPLDVFLNDKPFLGMQSQASRELGGTRVIFEYLTHSRMKQLATAYFDSYNLLYPFMDRDVFMSDTLAKVEFEGFDSDPVSVIALLVFALGEIAEDSMQMPASQSQYGKAIRGDGSSMSGLERAHPGISLFNEARKRIGFVMTECGLENVQAFSLAALYLQSCACHVDFWRMTVSASSACEVLVTCNPIDWDSLHGDLVRCAYWHCAILETGLHLELDLPLTRLLQFQNHVASLAPKHPTPSSELDDVAHEVTSFRAYYGAQIALRRLCADVHDKINESMGTNIAHDSTSDVFDGPTADTLDALASELQEWRNMLIPKLQWPEDDITAYPDIVNEDLIYHQNIDPTLAYPSKLFSIPSQQPQTSFLPYVYDIQVALLRTRYSYAKYMVYRPYIYKALHFPNQITQKDAHSIAICLKACLKWPITMAPTSRRKRLIPYLFCWSQNMLGIILILHLSKVNPALWSIRKRYCGGEGSQFDSDVEESIELMVDWIADLKEICPIARWCLSVLEPLLELEE